MKSILGHADIARFVRSNRISWLGHVQRVGGHRTPKKNLSEEILGREKRGRPRKIRITGVEGDLRKMNTARLASEDRIGGGLCGRTRFILDCSATVMMMMIPSALRNVDEEIQSSYS